MMLTVDGFEIGYIGLQEFVSNLDWLRGIFETTIGCKIFFVKFIDCLLCHHLRSRKLIA